MEVTEEQYRNASRNPKMPEPLRRSAWVISGDVAAAVIGTPILVAIIGLKLWACSGTILFILFWAWWADLSHRHGGKRIY